MKVNNEYDALGELFRQRLENHTIPVDGNGWAEIERRLGKRTKKSAVWLWSIGVAAAASVAMMFIVHQPDNDEISTIVPQQEVPEKTETIHHQITTNPEFVITTINTETKHRESNEMMREKNLIATGDTPVDMQSAYREIINNGEIEEIEKTDSVIQLFNKSAIEKSDISLVSDQPDEEVEIADTGKKWLLAAAFGTGGSTGSFTDTYQDNMMSPSATNSYGFTGNNDYAKALSGSILSLNDVPRKEFTNIRYSQPFSLGITARKSLGKHTGVESGLVYTYLSSHFQWKGYDVRQSLHYAGIPVNAVVYFGSGKSNWRAYLSGGFMVEKGVRGILRQEIQNSRENRSTTVKSSSIGGVQLSLNGALGINYRLEKGWGICFEPRIGYSFDCNQPVSVRTEMPVFFGIHLGLNYEL